MTFFFRRRLKQGEVQALYDRHGPALLLYARSLLGRKSAAEDALQQVFMKLLEQNSIPEDPRPYLFRAVHNTALNLMRSERHDVDLADIEPWFEAPAQDRDALASLKAGLTQVTPEQREVLVLHLWGGLSFEEAGRVLSIPANTAASRYRYALQKLRSIMHPQDEL
jgi:RNA polymerase sigma-70 factor (ECF subfamily)